MRDILHGSVNQSATVRIVDSTDGTPETGVTTATGGLSFFYRRESGAVVAIGSLSDLSALTDAHTDGGIKHISAGYYRVDVPDAAWASGQPGVIVGGAATGMVVIAAYYPLVAFNGQDAAGLGLSRLDAAVGTRALETSVDTVEASLSTLTTRIPDILSLANINAEVDTAFNTVIPGGPTAGSINERLVAIDDKLPAGNIGDATAANQTTILDRIGAFTGSGVNTVLGFFKALMSKTATTPSDVGGTFAAADDSTEAIRDRGDAAWITGAGGDIWLTNLPGSYTAGQAGKIVGDNLNATVSSRAQETSVTSALDRIGGFTGTGINNILGFFRALMSKSATTPSDVGGTFAAADDSTEAIRDRGDTKREVRGTYNIDSGGDMEVIAFLQNSDGSIADCTACVLVFSDFDGTSVIASNAWTTGPTENTGNSTWYATKTGAGSLTTAGKVYQLSVTLTHNAVAYSGIIEGNSVS